MGMEVENMAISLSAAEAAGVAALGAGVADALAGAPLVTCILVGLAALATVLGYSGVQAALPKSA